jgi:poly(3-hydroxybutyrate) depolymerase
VRRSLALLLLGMLGVAACTGGGDQLRLASAGHLAVGTSVQVRTSSDPTLAAVPAHVPTNPTTVGVVVLHSYGHTDTEPVRQGWSAASDRYGFVALYPSRSSSWNAGLCCGSAAASGRDDVAWLVALIADAKRRYGLQTIYLAGFSNGGMMAERLVAEHPEVSSRLVTWGAAPEMPWPGPWNGTGILYTGEFDQTVPVDGGVRIIEHQATVMRPGPSTGQWLPGAHLQSVVVPGDRHDPPPDWPDRAWLALTSPLGMAPRT